MDHHHTPSSPRDTKRTGKPLVSIKRSDLTMSPQVSVSSSTSKASSSDSAFNRGPVKKSSSTSISRSNSNSRAKSKSPKSSNHKSATDTLNQPESTEQQRKLRSIYLQSCRLDFASLHQGLERLALKAGVKNFTTNKAKTNNFSLMDDMVKNMDQETYKSLKNISDKLSNLTKNKKKKNPAAEDQGQGPGPSKRPKLTGNLVIDLTNDNGSLFDRRSDQSTDPEQILSENKSLKAQLYCLKKEIKLLTIENVKLKTKVTKFRNTSLSRLSLNKSGCHNCARIEQENLMKNPVEKATQTEASATIIPVNEDHQMAQLRSRLENINHVQRMTPSVSQKKPEIGRAKEQLRTLSYKTCQLKPSKRPIVTVIPKQVPLEFDSREVIDLQSPPPLDTAAVQKNTDNNIFYDDLPDGQLMSPINYDVPLVAKPLPKSKPETTIHGLDILEFSNSDYAIKGTDHLRKEHRKFRVGAQFHDSIDVRMTMTSLSGFMELSSLSRCLRGKAYKCAAEIFYFLDGNRTVVEFVYDRRAIRRKFKPYSQAPSDFVDMTDAPNFDRKHIKVTFNILRTTLDDPLQQKIFQAVDVVEHSTSSKIASFYKKPIFKSALAQNG